MINILLAQALIRLTAENLTAGLTLANLLTKTGFDTKLMSLNKKNK